ncbi:MAG: TRAP transporter small permease [Deltaproteobacteria bacterium]|jgi:TRAP-type C4-dicarboxylate transport system permease small subunit|nr:TRAP transporter small permease [Deltaproteobacteria bacterium]
MAKRSPASTALFLIDRIVFHIEEKVVALSVIGLSVILVCNVVLRMFNSSLPSTEELSQFLMFFITFLGTSYAARTGMNIRMSMLSDAMKGKARKALAILVSALTAAVMFYVAYLSLRYVMKIASLHRVSPILRVPVQYVWIIMPVGMFLTGVQYGLALARNIISPGAWVSFSVPMEDEPSAFSDFDEKLIKDQGDGESPSPKEA